MLPEDRPTVDESYSRAIRSNHLESDSRRRGDLDLLIASGWARDGLGTSLYRLRTEFDGQRAAYQQADQALTQAREDVRHVLRKATVLRLTNTAEAMELHAKAIAMAKALTEQAERQALTSRALILVHLKSLRPARERLGAWALLMATKERYMADDATVQRIASRALQAWIDPICPACDGLGFTGEAGAVRLLCRACSGSTRRHVQLAGDDDGERFGRFLLSNMDRKAEAVARAMRRFLRRHDKVRDIEPAEQEHLQARLRALRSTQAEQD